MVTNEQKEILQKQMQKNFYMTAALSSPLCQSLTCQINICSLMLPRMLTLVLRRAARLGRKDILDKGEQEKVSELQTLVSSVQ